MGMELHIFYRNSNKKKLPDNPLLTRTVDSKLNFLWPCKDPKLFFFLLLKTLENLSSSFCKNTLAPLPPKKNLQSGKLISMMASNPKNKQTGNLAACKKAAEQAPDQSDTHNISNKTAHALQCINP